MAVGNIYVFAFLTALVAVNLIFAEENTLEQGSEFFDQVDSGADADREARSPNEDEEGRFFFNIPLIGTCNYTAQAGTTCASCTVARTCFANNLAIIRICRGFLPYCNNGRCSFIASTNCTSG